MIEPVTTSSAGRLIAIDPGKNLSGIAIFDRGTLTIARALRGCPSSGASPWERLDVDPRMLIGPSLMVVERPQVYRAGRSKVKPGSILDVAIAAGAWKRACADLGAEVEEVEPGSWKGQMPKDQVHRLARHALRPEERLRVPKIAKNAGRLDMWDAISLGLWRLGRLRLR